MKDFHHANCWDKPKRDKIKKYLDNLKNCTWNEGYIEYHQNKIDCLEWLLASYEGRAGKPIELLESLMIELPKETDDQRRKLDWIRILWNWIYKDRIFGF